MRAPSWRRASGTCTLRRTGTSASCRRARRRGGRLCAPHHPTCAPCVRGGKPHRHPASASCPPIAGRGAPAAVQGDGGPHPLVARLHARLRRQQRRRAQVGASPPSPFASPPIATRCCLVPPSPVCSAASPPLRPAAALCLPLPSALLPPPHCDPLLPPSPTLRLTSSCRTRACSSRTRRR